MNTLMPRPVLYAALSLGAVAVVLPAYAKDKPPLPVTTPPAPAADPFVDANGNRKPFLERLKRVERKTFVARAGASIDVEVVPRTSLVLHLPVDCVNLWNEWYAAPEACTPKHVEEQWWAPYATFTDAGIDVTMPAPVVAETWGITSTSTLSDLHPELAGVLVYTDTLDKARAWAANPGDWVEERVQGKDGVVLVGVVPKEGLTVQPPRGGLMCLPSDVRARWEACKEVKGGCSELFGRAPAMSAEPIVRWGKANLKPDQAVYDDGNTAWLTPFTASWRRDGDERLRRSKELASFVADPSGNEYAKSVDGNLGTLAMLSSAIEAKGIDKAKILWGGRKVGARELEFLQYALQHADALKRRPAAVSIARYDARSLVLPDSLNLSAQSMVKDIFDSMVPSEAAVKVWNVEWSGRHPNYRYWLPREHVAPRAWKHVAPSVDLNACRSSKLECLQGYIALVEKSWSYARGMYEEDGLNVPALPDADGNLPDTSCESAPHEAYGTRLMLSPDTPAGVRFRPVKVWVPDYPASWKSAQLMPNPAKQMWEASGTPGEWHYTITAAQLHELFD